MASASNANSVENMKEKPPDPGGEGHDSEDDARGDQKINKALKRKNSSEGLEEIEKSRPRRESGVNNIGAEEGILTQQIDG